MPEEPERINIIDEKSAARRLLRLFRDLTGADRPDTGPEERELDRGGLAALRLGLSDLPDANAALYPYVFPCLDGLEEGAYWRLRPVFFQVAALFGLHPHNTEDRVNVGDLCRSLGDHESAEKRFVLLLNARREALPALLRQVFAMAASDDRRQPINYSTLIWDLRNWDRPDRRVQLAWARRYWRYAPDETAAGPEPGADARTTG